MWHHSGSVRIKTRFDHLFYPFRNYLLKRSDEVQKFPPTTKIYKANAYKGYKACFLTGFNHLHIALNLQPKIISEITNEVGVHSLGYDSQRYRRSYQNYHNHGIIILIIIVFADIQKLSLKIIILLNIISAQQTTDMLSDI